MKKKNKGELSRREILDAALEEFSTYGYAGASLNRVCKEKDLSKGRIYHHFKDKDELYLKCLEDCFNQFREHLADVYRTNDDGVEIRIKKYFDTRIHFFMDHPQYLGIFMDVALNMPDQLKDEIQMIRNEFDRQSTAILKDILHHAPIREDLNLNILVEDIKVYMNFTNMNLRDRLSERLDAEDVWKQHEERVHRQLDLILYGILERGDINGE